MKNAEHGKNKSSRKHSASKMGGIFKPFSENRMYLCILLLTAICAYGYKVTNVTIGIDDTPSLYYFEEGLIAIVGRWVLFLLNKICSIAEFLPFLTDFAAVVLLVIAAIVWSALFYSVFGEKIPMVGYAFSPLSLCPVR